MVGGLSVPLALFMGSPAATVAVITVTACAIFAALPNFWTVPAQFLTGAAAAVGIALINTFGNVAGFAAGYVTGWLKDFSGSYMLPMFVVGGLMLLSGVLMVALGRRGERPRCGRAPADDDRSAVTAEARPMTCLFNDPTAFADEVPRGFRRRPPQLGPPRARRRRPGRGADARHRRGRRRRRVRPLPGLRRPGRPGPGPRRRGRQHLRLAVGPAGLLGRQRGSTGAGVLLTYGNYAGDVLHFDGGRRDAATKRASPQRHRRSPTTSPAPPRDEVDKRRGIAGDLTVFKAAAAAAEAGCPWTRCTASRRRANDRTRSFGVAFSGCTLPGATEPLFTVTAGRMARRPGHPRRARHRRDRHARPPTTLAELLVSRLLQELPADLESARGARVGVILNGLGTVKHEELFVVYRRVAQLLKSEGVEIVHPEVGELVTSFDMAGLSLTLFWLDDELEHYWTLPVHTAAFRKGNIDAVAVRRRPVSGGRALADEPVGARQRRIPRRPPARCSPRWSRSARASTSTP